MKKKPTYSELIAKWRAYANEAERDLGAAIARDSRTQLKTEARILRRCARQLEQYGAYELGKETP